MYHVEVNSIEVYPIEAYITGKGVVEVSGCQRLIGVKLNIGIQFDQLTIHLYFILKMSADLFGNLAPTLSA